MQWCIWSYRLLTDDDFLTKRRFYSCRSIIPIIHFSILYHTHMLHKWNIYLYIYHRFKPNVGRLNPYMDPLGYPCCYGHPSGHGSTTPPRGTFTGTASVGKLQPSLGGGKFQKLRSRNHCEGSSVSKKWLSSHRIHGTIVYLPTWKP